MNYKIFIKYFFTIILFIIISGCSKQINFPKIEEGIFSDREIKTYRSKKIRITTGDTLISISKKYKVSIQEIIKFNSLKPPYVLKPGKTLSLPKAIKYKIKEPTDKDIAIKIVPTHFPNINPDNKATGEPKPSNKTHMTTNKKNKDNKAK